MNPTSPKTAGRKGRRHFVSSAPGAVALALCLCGCVHSHSRNGLARAKADILLPELTALAAGPAALLLTNTDGFQADVAISLGEDARPWELSGQIFALGGKLRLEVGAGGSKPTDLDEFGVIWDASAHRGYVISEALQGYAGIAEKAGCTNLVILALPGQPEPVQGHIVDKAEATFAASDGQVVRVQLTRARDLGDLPLELESVDPGNSFQVTLSKVRPGAPARELFQPPDDFTRYASETALGAELVDRQQSVLGGGSDREHEGGSEPGKRRDSQGGSGGDE